MKHKPFFELIGQLVPYYFPLENKYFLTIANSEPLFYLSPSQQADLHLAGIRKSIRDLISFDWTEDLHCTVDKTAFEEDWRVFRLTVLNFVFTFSAVLAIRYQCVF